MKYKTPTSVASLIGLIRRNEDRSEPYCIYGEGDSAEATLSSICFIEHHPEVTDDYEEIYPQFVNDNNLELWFKEELVQDVVANALHQDPNVSDATILEAIKHYDEMDSFMNLT